MAVSRDQVRAIIRLLREGRTPGTIAQDMGVSARSVAAVAVSLARGRYDDDPAENPGGRSGDAAGSPDCDVCRGTGWCVVTTYGRDNARSGERIYPCVECRPPGPGTPPEPCPTCSGSGAVWQAQIVTRPSGPPVARSVTKTCTACGGDGYGGPAAADRATRRAQVEAAFKDFPD